MTASNKVRTIVAQVQGVPVPPEEHQSVAAARAIPSDHPFKAKALKPLSRALFSSSVALGHAVTAYREFARIKSSSVSPDGMLGGMGYVMQIREVRSRLQEACEVLSAVTDTLYDEINAPHWKPKMAELTDNEAEDVTELVDEAEEVIADPEGFGEQEIEKIESRNDGSGGGPDETSSEVPGALAQPEGQTEVIKQASLDWKAASSVPVTTLPGPRVVRRTPVQPTEQEWPMEGVREPDYTVPDYTSVFAESVTPTDFTPTDADDFGLGYGARGEGTKGESAIAPDGRGVPGPASGLPQASGNPYLEGFGRNLWGESDLPGEEPVARSDYYEGDKGNQFNVNLHAESQLPGNPADYNYEVSVPNSGYVVEDPTNSLIKIDWGTHNYKHQVK